jgi:hypothetical protein
MINSLIHLFFRCFEVGFSMRKEFLLTGIDLSRHGWIPSFPHQRH